MKPTITRTPPNTGLALSHGLNRRASLPAASRGRSTAGRCPNHRDGECSRLHRESKSARALDECAPPGALHMGLRRGLRVQRPLVRARFGPTFLSLIDPSNAGLIDTIGIRPNQASPDNDGGFAVPFFTYDGLYHVPHPDKDRRGTPFLLRLRDLTGEGVAGQFVLFDHVASGIAAASVLGYSFRSDIVVQYPVESTLNRFNPVVETWAIQVFDRKPSPAGYWKFIWEPGRGDSAWIDEEVRSIRQGSYSSGKKPRALIPDSHRFTATSIPRRSRISWDACRT